ncbi:Conserved_hypothetical protein [Hexamita inflata]|uniref:Uncharacterized protein n=1 Tax=Hexamita inflata TaxID=28002 RepID=A0AA86QJX9_9EUKA|nr:Conserved hypothetical protein [Hexamita inflata]
MNLDDILSQLLSKDAVETPKLPVKQHNAVQSQYSQSNIQQYVLQKQQKQQQENNRNNQAVTKSKLPTFQSPQEIQSKKQIHELEKQQNFDQFLKRNDLLLQRKEKTIDSITKQQAAQCSFQPQINVNSKQMQINRRPVYEVPARKHPDSFNQFNFQPEINEYSKQLAQQKPNVFDYQAQVEHKKQRVAQLAEQNKAEVHQDRYVNIQYEHVKNKISAENCIDYAREKAQKQIIEQAKKNQEIKEKELQGCTFKPEVYKGAQQFSDVARLLKQK